MKVYIGRRRTDTSQLANMAKPSEAALEAENIEAFADSGYFKGEGSGVPSPAKWVWLVESTVQLPNTARTHRRAHVEGPPLRQQDFRYVAEERTSTICTLPVR